MTGSLSDAAPPAIAPPPGFLFATCQIGAHAALKAELARVHPEIHLAFSRPGFLTFKLPSGGWDPAAHLDLAFARTQGVSLGKVTGDTPDALAAAAWRLAGTAGWQALHVWQRDTLAPGQHGFEPGITPLAVEARAALLRATTSAALERAGGQPANDLPAGAWVLDCVIVEPGEWWLGYHAVGGAESRWPGGVPAIALPERAVSRAYLKMEEALRWSGVPIQAGDECAEIGCAPGGAAQALLDHGLAVVGIDPADVDPRLLAEPGFTHLKMRGADVRRRVFHRTRWLTADINVAPQYTLDTVEAIVTHPSVDVQGLLLTLKLSDWQLAGELPEYLARVRSWGYDQVGARQLAFNRQEVCVAALRKPQPRGRSPRTAARKHVPSRLASRRRLNL